MLACFERAALLRIIIGVTLFILLITLFITYLLSPLGLL